MKKTLVAGAASAVLAAMPLVGVMAADPAAITDTITVNVSPTCSFERTTGNGTYSATLPAASSTVNTAIGSSTFTAICNNATGFNVGTVAEDLTGPGQAITFASELPTAGGGTWAAKKSNNQYIAGAKQESGDNAGKYTGGTLMSTNTVTPAAGQTETVTYQASIRDNQASGSYTGHITYTLVQNS